jgi:pyruvate dehydrogenase (quinone)
VLRRAAALLNEGKKPVILAGRGAIGARKELEEIAEILGAPIAKPVLGKACVPDDSPYCTGGVGLLGTRPSQEALEGCDTLLIVGSSFPYIEFYPKIGQARCVQIDIDAPRIGLRYPAEVGPVGDSIRVLRRLVPLLDRKAERDWLKQAEDGKAEWDKLMLERASRQDMPMKPQVVAHEIGKRLKDDAIIATDSGTRSRPGRRATSVSAAIRCSRCPAISRRWRAACLMRSARRSPIPTGRSWLSSAMAD